MATQEVIAREGLARIMRMFQLERLCKERPHEERKALRDRHLRPHVESFIEFVAEEYERVKHQRGMLRSALGYCVRQKDALPRRRAARDDEQPFGAPDFIPVLRPAM